LKPPALEAGERMPRTWEEIEAEISPLDTDVPAENKRFLELCAELRELPEDHRIKAFARLSERAEEALSRIPGAPEAKRKLIEAHHQSVKRNRARGARSI
jgi:hypothetical protein